MMTGKTIKGFWMFLFVFLIYPVCVFADSSFSKYEPRPGFHWVMLAGMTYGGDTLFTAQYTDGSEVDVTAGGLIQFGLGGLYQFKLMPIALRATVYRQNDWAFGTNGEAIFSRLPVEVLAYYTGRKRLRIGGGMRFVGESEMVVTVNGKSGYAFYDKTQGLVLEAGYQITQAGWVNLRYVSEKYYLNRVIAFDGKVTNFSGVAADSGSHMGLIISYEF